jgi:hypothetical protein
MLEAERQREMCAGSGGRGPTRATTAPAKPGAFYGWRVVGAAFVVAIFGWGLGFYGPPVYLHAVRELRGWSLALVSVAVTAHFLIGAIVVANLPKLYRRFGVSAVTQAPWQLLAATLFSGAGWAAMGAAAVNQIVSPWFIRARPAALSMAYNGASVGGIVFSPLWVAAIALMSFPVAAPAIGVVTVLTIWLLADLILAKTPRQMGLLPDGDAVGVSAIPVASPSVKPLPGSRLWRDPGFLTLSAGMALGLFAQIGLIAHLFSLLVPALGAQSAGLAIGAATAAAIIGRTLVGWLMPAGADRRLVACASYGVQIAGSIAFLFAAGTNIPLLLFGVILFGAGIGNATSLPPLIAQVEFTKEDVPRVVALIVAMAQGGYAFAPAAFGLMRELASRGTFESAGAAPYVFAAAALLQVLAMGALLVGRRR